MENQLPEMTHDDFENVSDEQKSGEDTANLTPDKAPVPPEPIPESSSKILDPIGSVASFLVPFLIYIFSIAPNVMPGDAGEFIVAINRFSLAHPPGYPLYMLLLKIWSVLPVNIGPDPLAVKLNLFSAFTMALMCFFFYKTSRLITGSPAASLAAVLILAFSRTIWKFAVVTEVYSLHLLLIVLVLYGLALARVNKNPMGLVVTAFAFGLGLAHHHTIVLMLPLIIILWPKGKTLEKIPVIPIIAGVLLPLLLYAFLPIFASNTPEFSGKGFTAGNFIDYVSRVEYRQRADFQDPNITPLVKPGDILLRTYKFIVKQFGAKLFSWIVLILSVAGFFFAPPGRRIWGLLCALTAIIWIIAVAFLSRGSPLGMPFNYLRSVDEFLLPVNIFIAFGFAWLLAPFSKSLLSRQDVLETDGQNFIPSKYIPVIIMVLLCVIPFFTWMMNNRYSNLSHHTFYQDQSRNILEQVPQDGVLIATGDEMYIYEYLTEVRELRPDVELVEYPFAIPGFEDESNASRLGWYLQNELGDRTCVFTFNEAADALAYLPGKALRMDGVALTLVDSEDPGLKFFPGAPNDTWMNYQLRNINKATFFRFPEEYYEYDEGVFYIVPDDFEYEVFDRYVNGLRASTAWLENEGYANDYSRIWLMDYTEMLEKIRDATDYPQPPQ